ncbi:Quinonprotein alcohol dehydrogenase-like superfamily [Ostreococcus tauri]|uniref:Quinonprotein alcohol dehydrogenase-like superfamily n=1 Tax=Ostreococcus tauri TaxID=70448 RepID=A0A090N3W8_OSTTA|nr:Quinonprotein alcohol dehydrogenase-like superfamily [Ostreococcus tauri]CEF98843.1 Quinonprotein alcohol dehydrogenase-like superfamily [Ostreococcus tauri]|eukprot:XP_022839502.1 Quinonprotein alcohol dehydrogenase-like superfamily [Ostreococcus tauri]
MRASFLSTHANNALLGVATLRNDRCVSTVREDGVVVHDVDGERRERTWALDRGRAFACAVVADGAGERYYACLERADGKTELCAWSEADGAEAATVGEASKGCVKEIAMNGSARVRELIAVEGGALVVTTSGDVQLFNASAELVHSASQKSGTRRIEFASALPESVGALVVTTDGKSKKHRVSAYVVAVVGDKRRLTQAWELDVSHPDSNDKARIATATSDGETLMILWDDGLWVLHDTSDGSIIHRLQLNGLDCQVEEPLSGKRSKKSETSSSIASTASMCLSSDYYAVVANSKEEQTVIVAVIDSRYGAIHLAEDVSQGLENKVGRTSGVCLAAIAGGLIIGLSDQLLSVQLALPELSLASLVGSLTVQPDVSAAAIRILGAEAVSVTSTPKQHAVVMPGWNLDDVKADGQGVIHLGDDWTQDDSQALEKSVKSTAEALASGSKKANSSLESMMKTLPIPQILIDSAITGGLTHRSWEPVSTLLHGGHISGSSVARHLVPALIEEDMIEEIRSFLVNASDISSADVSAILCSALSRDAEDPVLKKRAAVDKKLAEKALEEAEVSSSNDKSEARQHLIARAQLLVCAYDAFAPWAQQLHALVARPLDPTTSSSVLRELSKRDAVALLNYLLVWANFYASSDGLFARINTLSEPGIPSAHAVVNWACALLDAQLAMFCLAGDVAERVRALEAASNKMLDMMRAVTTLRGALRHVGENSPLPEQHGVVSTTYTVESVAW